MKVLGCLLRFFITGSRLFFQLFISPMIISKQQFEKPDPRLTDLIDHYWFSDVLDSEAGKISDHTQIQLPESFIDWYFCYQGTSHLVKVNTESFMFSGSIVLNGHRIDRVVSFSNFSIPFRGMRVRFKSIAFYRLFNIALRELNTGVFLPDDVLGPEILSLQEKIENSNEHNQRKKYLDDFFISRLNSNSKKTEALPWLTRVWDIIKISNGSVRLNDLAEELDISERTFERYFNKYLGYHPKELCEIYRLKHLLREILARDIVDWNEFAFAHGYYDQAHMINDIRKATTQTPGWLKDHKNRDFIIANSLLIFLSNDLIRSSIEYMNSHCRLKVVENRGWIHLDEISIPP